MTTEPREPLDRHARAVRRLSVELECLAAASERGAGTTPLVRRRAHALGAATRHAVALDLLTAEEATAIWASVGRRHPGAGWCRNGCPGL